MRQSTLKKLDTYGFVGVVAAIICLLLWVVLCKSVSGQVAEVRPRSLLDGRVEVFMHSYDG